jgi:type IV pilus assembly protein PilY1
VVVYYGANDGFLRAVDGRKTGTTAGQELWSFVAPEHYPVLKRLYDNAPALHLPATTSTGGVAAKASATDEKKAYAMDGPIGVFARYSSSNTINEAIIYAAMRRGGNAIYAFDVTSKTEPRLKFKIANTTSGYESLGQTWSMPRPVIFPAAAGAPFDDPIVFMGGGYDPAEDTNTSSGIGNVVYIINGRTGQRLAALPTDYSVPADVSVVDTNRDGIYDRAYAADVRGNLYRISMTDSAGTLLAPSAWTIRKIARLNGKVFGAPDVVATGQFIAVMVGTGDREKPLLASSNDHFFVIKDTTLTQPDRTGELEIGNLQSVGHVDDSSSSVVADAVPATSLSIRNGCYVSLSTRGEKVVNSPFTIAGVTYFGTNRPTAADEHTCSANLGQARAYQFSLFCGVVSSTVLAGGGMPPSPVGGFVTMTVGSTSQLVPFIIGGGGVSRSTSGTGGGSPSEGNSHEANTPPGSVAPVRKKQYYRIHNNNR